MAKPDHENQEIAHLRAALNEAYALIAGLQAEVELWRDRYASAAQALEATIKQWDTSLSEGS